MTWSLGKTVGGRHYEARTVWSINLGMFAGRLEVRFVEGEEPLIVVECFRGSIGLLKALGQIARRLDGDPLGHGGVGGAQDPLPGLETPRCR